MREINVLGYSLKQGVKNLRKNRLFTLASMGTVAACLLIFGLVYGLIYLMTAKSYYHIVERK